MSVENTILPVVAPRKREAVLENLEFRLAEPDFKKLSKISFRDLSDTDTVYLVYHT